MQINYSEFTGDHNRQPRSLPRLQSDKQRKYDKGSNPCGNCGTSGAHARCRPKLDGTLCSCSCPRAQNMREEFEAQQLKAEISGTEIPSIQQIAKTFTPRYEKIF